MRIIEAEQRAVWSASDLTRAAECEFAWARAIDARLGRVPAVEEPEDPTLERAIALGEVHETRVLAEYRTRFGEERVAEIARVSSADAEGLAAAVVATEETLRLGPEAGPAVVFQAAFATDEFVGFADFLLRDPDGRWRVQDTKLARHARSTALIQVAAYVAQLDRLEIPRSDDVELILGDGSRSAPRGDDILPLFRVRRVRLRALVADRRIADGAAGEALAWGDERGDLGVRACGRCATCEEQAVACRDLLLVARMRPAQRDRLRAAGIETMDALADAEQAPTGMNAETFTALRAQARLQRSTDAGSAVSGDGRAGAPDAVALPSPPAVEVYAPESIHTLPKPDPGDIYFDFEGDPLHAEERPGHPTTWGLDYLFGWVDDAEQYSALWAHDLTEERRALEEFLDFVHARRAAHPGMHIYHYAPYEPAHLVAMAARHGVRERDVDRLLREGVFVDLYPVVLRTVRVGTRSYSIKKLEPLYMGAEVRTSDVQRGDDSITHYTSARELRQAGEEEAAQQILADLADYNRYDCVSTRRLRNWLVRLALAHGVVPALPDVPDEGQYEPSHRSVALLAAADRAEEEDRDAEAWRVAAAAVDYYPREAKGFWVAHYQRLREPAGLWDQTRNVVRTDPDRSRVVQDWAMEERARSLSRRIVLRGEIAPGTTLGVGAQPFALYPVPAPFDTPPPSRAIHVPLPVEIVEVLPDGYVVKERSVRGQTWDALPLALTPPAPPRVQAQQVAIDEWADRMIRTDPEYAPEAATDILRRIPPRTVSGSRPWAEEAAGGDAIDRIVRGVLDLEHSYLAVQGPPGTGKTFTGSRVISRLVREHGFRVGVVAQSHAIVENLLERVIDDGVPPHRVAKAPKDPDREHAFTVIRKTGMASFLAEHRGSGVVVGGTAWDFANPDRVARGELDLLVIDEAGQFSLAATIAVAAGAQRLLLLGDPQQLPEVSQGAHPEPVNTSALGWVMTGHDVLPADHGVFLARSWRMHPAVAAPVSQLSYAGRLASAPAAAQRHVDGIEPGLHPLPLRHRGNATASPEEALEVVRIVRVALGQRYRAGDAAPRPLEPSDVIVVTPYNAQRQCVEEALAAAGFAEVPVGTVDNFQGKEAVISITSLAASSGWDAPRGPEFLLLQNRLNVAISRAKWAAYLLYSPGLLDDLPYTPEGVARLSAFARLTGVG